ncbi:MAG: pantoate--beta-alanine ligase [bacterium]
MRVITSIKEMHAYSVSMKIRSKTIAFVPTMGFLHEGHLSLVEAARERADLVVVSIFVNPTQFGPKEDLSKYPRDIANDKKQLKNFDVDILFLPSAADLYPDEYKSYVEVEELSKRLCGQARPQHFRGVATIVTKLFNIVLPDYAIFGEKDYQQLIIIKRLVKDLNLPVHIVGLPIVREFDGLAMSSRNKYLTPKEREHATVLYKALQLAKKEIENGEKNCHKILLRVRSLVGSVPSMHLDYASIVDPITLVQIPKINGKVLIALAAHLGKARLIDNVLAAPK